MLKNSNVIFFISGVAVYFLLCILIPISYEARLSVGLIVFIIYLAWLFLKKS